MGLRWGSARYGAGAAPAGEEAQRGGGDAVTGGTGGRRLRAAEGGWLPRVGLRPAAVCVRLRAAAVTEGPAELARDGWFLWGVLMHITSQVTRQEVAVLK